MLSDGVSEFTFSGLYLFRDTYDYKASRIDGQTYLVSGVKNGERFFFSPCCVPSNEVLAELFKTHSYLKNMAESQCNKERLRLEAASYEVSEDRDNFDYIYERKALAELSGKTYHKKRNLVNAFINSYTYEQKPLNKTTVGDAIAVLEAWHEEKGIKGDYAAAKEALDLYDILGMRGAVYYVDGRAAGYALGEPIAKARVFAVHFEKAIGEYKGIYQFINQAFAQTLPNHFRHVNREQDLGDEGLRQAKMTYRPCGFVKKFRVKPKSGQA
ncbi:phosphatidylglycerol lysyltransferase domain-containing protein [Spirochaetota bacterium]